MSVQAIEKRASLAEAEIVEQKAHVRGAAEKIRNVHQRVRERLAFPEAINAQGGATEHRMTCGTSLSFPLVNQSEISAARWFNSCGSDFPEHSHEQREWIIVYSGSMLLRIGTGPERRLLAGDYIVLEPRTSHHKRFDEDCWYMAVCVPREPNWPK